MKVADIATMENLAQQWRGVPFSDIITAIALRDAEIAQMREGLRSIISIYDEGMRPDADLAQSMCRVARAVLMPLPEEVAKELETIGARLEVVAAAREIMNAALRQEDDAAGDAVDRLHRALATLDERLR